MSVEYTGKYVAHEHVGNAIIVHKHLGLRLGEHVASKQ